jgi:surface-anchored protein
MNVAISLRRVGLALSAVVLVLASAAMAAAPVSAQEPVVLSVGHADAVDIHYEGGQLVLKVKDDTVEPSVTRDPADVIFQALPGSRVAIPDIPEYRFLGRPGDPVWVLPQAQDPTLLWPGWNTNNLIEGTFAGNRVELSLVDVDGPGQVSVFMVDAIGMPLMQWSTHDGLPDSITVPIRTHAHANWAFGAEGGYTLTFQVNATLANGTPITSGPVPYRFVVGEPGGFDPEVELAIQGLADRYEPGETVTLTAVQTPQTELDSYRWFSRCSAEAPFEQIAGEEAATYSFTATEQLDGCQYLAKLLNGAGNPVAEAAPVTLRVGTPDPGPGGASQTITARVDESQGALVISVNPDDRSVVLPVAQLGPAGDRLEAAGELRPVTVTDTRSGAPGWNAAGQLGDFRADGGAVLGGKYLGWVPSVLSQADGQGVVAGAAVPPGFSSGNGLAGSSVLGTAPAGSGRGTARLGADLKLELPTQTQAGTYTATLTLTAI